MFFFLSQNRYLQFFNGSPGCLFCFSNSTTMITLNKLQLGKKYYNMIMKLSNQVLIITNNLPMTLQKNQSDIILAHFVQRYSTLHWKKTPTKPSHLWLNRKARNHNLVNSKHGLYFFEGRILTHNQKVGENCTMYMNGYVLQHAMPKARKKKEPHTSK
jgi:hypothetical protein